MQTQANEPILRAILHSLPNAVIAVDETDNILVANNGAAKLLNTKRNYLEGGSIYRYMFPRDTISGSIQTISFSTPNGKIELSCISKELQVDESFIKVILLKKNDTGTSSNLLSLKEFAKDQSDPYQELCKLLVSENIASQCQVVMKSNNQTQYLASSTDYTETEINLKDLTPTVEILISQNEHETIQLVLAPSSTHGLNAGDLELIDLFISIIHLKVNSEETSSDANGSEAALALALKSGAMGLCFFDTKTKDCYLSERLSQWCGIDPESFDGKISSWVRTFSPNDASRVGQLFHNLEDQNKFKTIVTIGPLNEAERRLEISARPISEKNGNQWVAIVNEYKDENEVIAAWQTRIAMEESTRIEAENSLEEFENILHDTLLPTTSDVSIMHSRQDAGTFHIVRPINETSSIYGVGAITTNSRGQAVIGAAIVATIADVLASKTTDVDEFVKLIRDHARARDIETSMSAVLVSNDTIHAASIGGASVYISGKPFNGELKISANTAISLSSHSEASPDSVEVAANGRPWKIMTSVIEVRGHIDTNINSGNIISLDDEFYGAYKSPLSNDDSETKPEPKDNESIEQNNDNVRSFKSGSISPS